jgi:hypothetical protein
MRFGAGRVAAEPRIETLIELEITAPEVPDAGEQGGHPFWSTSKGKNNGTEEEGHGSD